MWSAERPLRAGPTLHVFPTRENPNNIVSVLCETQYHPLQAGCFLPRGFKGARRGEKRRVREM